MVLRVDSPGGDALASEEIVTWATIIAGLVVGAVLGAWFAIRSR